MILRALTTFASDDELPFGYTMRSNIGFQLVVSADGSRGSLRGNYQSDGKGGRRSDPQAGPNLTRSNNPPPLLACDTASFVLSLPKVAETPAGQAKEHAAAERKNADFTSLMLRYASEVGDPDASVYAGWVESGMPGLASSLEGLDDFERKRLATDYVSIRIEGSSSPIHAKPEAREFWSRMVQRRGGGALAVCISCGLVKPTVETLPTSLSGAHVPGTSTANVALLSVNFSSASRGARGTGLKSSPVCVECATRAVASFNALAAAPRHRWTSGADNPATIWWTSVVEDDIEIIGAPRPEQVERLFDSIRRGSESTLRVDDRFYLLTFKGNVARLVVYRWLDLPLAGVREHVAQWFKDTRSADPEQPYSSLERLAESAGAAPGKLEVVVPPGAVDALVLTAVAGSPPPRALLLQALTRARAEIHSLDHPDARARGFYRRRMHTRAGLLRLMLNRTTLKENPMVPEVDEDRSDPAYINGRLFAIRVSLQYRASGDVNASILDRFFERAAVNPLSAQHSLQSLGMQHLRALERKGDKAGSVAIGKQITDLEARAGEVPGRMSPEEQASWYLGFYQQRQANFAAASRKQSPAIEESAS